MKVRSNPATSALIFGKQYAGSAGLIVDGPKLASGYTWWQINFDTGADGWVEGVCVVPIAR